jgi:hypothetical protein
MEELARSALNPWRGNEVFPRHAFQVSLNHSEQARDLRVSYGTKLSHHDFWLFGFDQMMNLNPIFLAAGSLPVEKAIAGGFEFELCARATPRPVCELKS